MNPSHTMRLASLEKHYRDVCGYSVRFFKETAASTHDGMIEFWTDGDELHNEWGASTVVQRASSLSSAKNKKLSHALDLVGFILNEIKPFASVVVMKMDIEGSEHEILPQLLIKGALCDIDLIFIEYHPLVLSSSQNILLWHVNSVINAEIPGCKVKLNYLDDESFLHDADDTVNTC